MTPIVIVTHVWRSRIVFVHRKCINVSVIFMSVIHEFVLAVTPQPTSRIPTIAFLPPPALYNCVVSQPLRAFLRALFIFRIATCEAASPVAHDSYIHAGQDGRA